MRFFATGCAWGMALLVPIVCAADAPSGLDALSDQPLRVELAADGLSTLLERSFAVDKVSDQRQAAERAILELNTLSQLQLSPQERDARLKQIAGEIAPVLERSSDPQILLNAAALLVRQGVEQDVNVLEYFGDQDAAADATKARLQPLIVAVVGLYDRAVELLDHRQVDLQQQIRQPGDAASGQWQKVYQELQTASYTRWMLSYSHALSLDRADLNRDTTIDDGLKNLAQWDTSDSGVQPFVRFQMAKLTMLRGTREDLLKAKAMLAGATQPPADDFTEFNELYFSAICDVLSGNAEAAKHDAQVAEEFRRRKLPQVQGDEYAMAMLRYRIAILEGDKAGATKILEELSDQAPALRRVIASELIDTLPAHPDLTQLNSLILEALIERAWNAVNAGAGSVDKSVLDEGLGAADEFLARSRRSDPPVSAESAQYASLARGVFLKADGRLLEAAEAFADHAEKYETNPEAQPAAALNEAIALLPEIAGDSAHQQDVDALENRVLALAVDQFNRTDLAYDYARRLERAGNYGKAGDEFDRVPAVDPNAFNARFFKLLALNGELESAPNSQIAGDLRHLAGQVLAEAQNRQDATSDAKLRLEYQSIRVRTLLLAADAARRQEHDPRRALQLLSDIESQIAGLPDAKALLAEALNLRVQAYMSAGDLNASTNALLGYLNAVGGNEGLQAVYKLLTKINNELGQAQNLGDQERVKQLADDRAALTPFLVQWAASNPNPDIRRFEYRYRVFDAATQQLAASLEGNPKVRHDKLGAALGRFRELQSPENVALYQKSLPSDADPDLRNSPDPAVTLGIGEVAFDLGAWKLAHDSIGELLADSRLGDGTTEIKNAAGQDELVDNEQFWEAQYKFIYATAELVKDPASGVEESTPRIMLARLQAAWQERVGGKKWHGKFEELGKELVGQGQ
jgi:hypothetical protein